MTMGILLKPVATVRNPRTTPTDDHWGSVISEIELAPYIPDEAFAGIGSFSHLEIIYYFNQTGDAAGSTPSTAPLCSTSSRYSGNLCRKRRSGSQSGWRN
jgi:tRNA (Thr-GGU) A37 N-methylase